MVWWGIHGCELRRSQYIAANDILATPLFDTVQEDKVTWIEEWHGSYFVKSGYNLVLKEFMHNNQFHVEGEWNNIWKFKAPHKVINLLWCLYRGCVPTCVRPSQWHVQCTPVCPWCESDEKNECHAFVGCSVAKDSWFCSGLSIILLSRLRIHTIP